MMKLPISTDNYTFLIRKYIFRSRWQKVFARCMLLECVLRNTKKKQINLKNNGNVIFYQVHDDSTVDLPYLFAEKDLQK